MGENRFHKLGLAEKAAVHMLCQIRVSCSMGRWPLRKRVGLRPDLLCLLPTLAEHSDQAARAQADEGRAVLFAQSTLNKLLVHNIE